MTFFCLSYFGIALAFYITESAIQGYRNRQCDFAAAWIIWPIVLCVCAIVIVATVVEHTGNFSTSLGKTRERKTTNHEMLSEVRPHGPRSREAPNHSSADPAQALELHPQAS